VYFTLKILLKREKNKQEVGCGRSRFMYEKYFLFHLLYTIYITDDSRAKRYRAIGYYPHAVTATIIHGGKNDREISLDPFFYTYSRKQMSRETSTDASASICTIHIFRRVTDRFCYFSFFSLSLSFFFVTQTTMSSYNEYEQEKEKETETRRETGITRKEARYYWSTLSRRMS